jgi:hypothetical protein
MAVQGLLRRWPVATITYNKPVSRASFGIYFKYLDGTK